MKTALTQLIEKLIDKYGSDNNFINEAITDAMLFKKAEKEQIKNSYGAGAMDATREEVLQVENKPFDREFILCASLKFHDNIVSGHRHSDCYELIRKMCPNITDTSLPQREDQGFLTSLNRHVDRREGWKIAKENNQIKWGLNASDDNEESQLISENLY